ncbi:MAG: hypothetical protein IKS31_12405 [Clostridia bacterium]|nr:hypothetical protein [Clostridia bacterium]
MKDRQTAYLRVTVILVMIIALATCALLVVQHRNRAGKAAGIQARANSAEAYYDAVVASKEALIKIRETLEAEEMELEQQIADAKSDAKKRLDKVAEWEAYLSREAAASAEAWRLEKEIASLEAWLSAEAR